MTAAAAAGPKAGGDLPMRIASPTTPRGAYGVEVERPRLAAPLELGRGLPSPRPSLTGASKVACASRAFGHKPVLVPKPQGIASKRRRYSNGQCRAGRTDFRSTIRLGGASGPNPRPACHAEGRGFESHHPLLLDSPAKRQSRSVLLLAPHRGRPLKAVARFATIGIRQLRQAEGGTQ